jgi:uncharacterized protein (DUF1501 family)
MSDLTRREVLRNGGLLAVGLMAPPWLASIAEADMVRGAQGKKLDPDAVLVVCQLSGGNDGLNTVVPVNSEQYYKMRPTLGIPKDQALGFADGLAFHPAMAGMHELYKKGQVAVIQNVGYPNPNRSHFRSMDIWQSASPDDKMKHGWLGRHFDISMKDGKLDPVAAIGLSTEKPRALSATQASIPCFASLADIQNMVGDADMEKLLRDVQGTMAAEGTTARAIQQANISALDAVSALNTKLKGYTPTGTYGDDAFGRGFKQITQLIAVSPQTRVIYFSVGGFDTHARQADAHKALMTGFSGGIKAFMDEMAAIGKADKVVVLVFSEFGRRTYENGSAGTDHGSAAPMFLVGSRVKGGVYGPNPDLADLQDGDIRHKIDFRQVYATALDDWMGSDSKMVLGSSFERIAALK